MKRKKECVHVCAAPHPRLRTCRDLLMLCLLTVRWSFPTLLFCLMRATTATSCQRSGAISRSWPFPMGRTTTRKVELLPISLSGPQKKKNIAEELWFEFVWLQSDVNRAELWSGSWSGSASVFGFRLLLHWCSHDFSTQNLSWEAWEFLNLSLQLNSSHLLVLLQAVVSLKAEQLMVWRPARFIKAEITTKPVHRGTHSSCLHKAELDPSCLCQMVSLWMTSLLMFCAVSVSVNWDRALPAGKGSKWFHV